MDRSKLEHIDAIYQCARATCTGAGDEAKGNLSCWNRKAFAGSNTTTKAVSPDEATEGECDSDALQCLKGSRSIMCGSCEDGYTFFDFGLDDCTGSCNDASSTSIPIDLCEFHNCCKSDSLSSSPHGGRVCSGSLTTNVARLQRQRAGHRRVV